MSTNQAAIGQLNPYFGRKYQVQVSVPNPDNPSQPAAQFIIADSDWEPSALRVTFDITMPAIQSYYWDATVCVYNPDRVTVDTLLTSQAQGMVVSVSAGYQNGNYDVIWEGEVFQAYVERENVADLKLTLYCILRLPPLANSDGIGATYEELATQNDIIQGIAGLLTTPIAALSQNLKPTKLPRSKTVFGNLDQHLDNLAADNNMQWWLTKKGLNFGSIEEDLINNTNPPLVFSPPENGSNSAGPPLTPVGTGTVIGTPQQTMYGVLFRVLLNPKVETSKPLMRVKIDNSAIRFTKRQLGQYIGRLDQDGQYVVAAVRHIGDTRGDPWYTEIQGWTQLPDGKLAFLAAAEQAALGGN